MMANMAHCRFRNTLADLKDCQEHLDEYDSLSREEKAAWDKLVALCLNIGVNYAQDD